VQERLLQTGLSFDGVIEVLQGLQAGERVVVRGNESLRQGQQVSVEE
jgi:multidrug efflux pump subunit AcrA (membrane-fusion protein)